MYCMIFALLATVVSFNLNSFIFFWFHTMTCFYHLVIKFVEIKDIQLYDDSVV